MCHLSAMMLTNLVLSEFLNFQNDMGWWVMECEPSVPHTQDGQDWQVKCSIPPEVNKDSLPIANSPISWPLFITFSDSWCRHTHTMKMSTPASKGDDHSLKALPDINQEGIMITERPVPRLDVVTYCVLQDLKHTKAIASPWSEWCHCKSNRTNTSTCNPVYTSKTHFSEIIIISVLILETKFHIH